MATNKKNKQFGVFYLGADKKYLHTNIIAENFRAVKKEFNDKFSGFQIIKVYGPFIEQEMAE